MDRAPAPVTPEDFARSAAEWIAVYRRVEDAAKRVHASEPWAGSCFRGAGELALALRSVPGVALVHGRPLGRAGEVAGRRFGHAWVEFDVFVFDVTVRAAPYVAPLYYEAGRIGRVTRRTPEEAAALMAARGHYGPWVNRRRSREEKRTR